MAEAKSRGLPLVLVTGDEKDDWWWRHRGQFLGPRTELTEEFSREVGTSLVFLRPRQLIDHADVLAVTVSEGAASEIERVTSDLEAGWSRRAVSELLDRLDAGGYPQAEVIRVAARQGGIIDKADVHRIAGRDEDRSLRGFTKPVMRITASLQDEGFLADDIEKMLNPLYPPGSGGVAEQFEIPLEVVEILSNDSE